LTADQMPSRLIIISDVHLPGPGPIADLFRRAIAKAAELNPAMIVLLGDTVETGKAEEYALALEIVKPVRLLIRSLPGNHELLTGAINDFRKTWLVEPATLDLIDNLPVMRFNTAVGGQKEEEYFGRVTPDQLRLLDALLSARPTLPAFMFSHHPLANTVRRSDEFQFTIENSQPVRDRLAAHAAPAIFFSGHTHWQSVKRFDRLTTVGCPPLGFWPHAFLQVDLDGSTVRYQTHRLIDSPDQSPDPKANDEAYRTAAEGVEADRQGVIPLDD
jgi:predicted MPP superfamily phosphohydrolase